MPFSGSWRPTITFRTSCIISMTILWLALPNLCHLIDLSTTTHLPHHHVTMNCEAHSDIDRWLGFLLPWNGHAIIPDPHEMRAPNLELFTDASGSIGYGIFYAGHWITDPWPPELINPMERALSHCSLMSPLGWSVVWKEAPLSLRQSSGSGHLGIRLFPRPPYHAPCRLNPPLLPGWHLEILWLLCLQRMAKFPGHLDHTTLLCPLLGWPRLLQDHKVIHDRPLFYIHWKQHTEPLLLSTAPSSLSAWNQAHHGALISSAPPCNHVPSSAD